MAVKKGKPTREERLAAALRENLKRRKARSRALEAPKEADAAAGPAEGEGTETPASRHQSATKQN